MFSCLKIMSNIYENTKNLTINISEGTGVNLLISISEIASGKCPALAPTKNSRDDAYIAPFKDPNVQRATNIDIIHPQEPSIFSLKVIATAVEDRISELDSTAKNATLVSAYTMVTTGMDMQIARGRFLKSYFKVI